MADSSVPDFFTRFPMQRVANTELDAELAVDDNRIAILFLWGRDCPNCDIAKRQMLLTAERFSLPEVRWLHDNVYDDPTMATRFGLHGIPAFFLFHKGRKLGRITSWPGTDAFVDAVNKQIGLTGASA
jgi:thiol-disulfide isomerase/thioredoxin